MNQKEFDALVKKSTEQFDAKVTELKALEDMLEDKREELEKFREDLLLNLIHEDICSYEDEDDDESFEIPDKSMTFLGETPSVEELEKSHAVVVHIMPGFLESDDEEENIDRLYVSVEKGVSHEELVGALAFACVKSIVDFVDKNADEVNFNINYDSIVDEMIEGIMKAIVRQSLLDAFKDL